MATAAALADVHQCLEWIGFGDIQHRNAIIDKRGFDRLTDFYDVNETDIRDMAESFSKRSPAANCIIFGMWRIKWLISLMHQAQDHQQCSEDPDLDDIANMDKFKEALLVSAQQASLRKTDAEQVDTISKAVDPGKFKDEKKWPGWEPAFVNYLSMIPGVRGVPLSYVVRENAAPDHEPDFGNDFVAHSIACMPLDNASFPANARKVHQLLMNFLVAESAEQWIKDLASCVNGRCDMEALHNHYGGEGNASRRIATAEKLRDSLDYKSECSLPFSTFLDRMQKMFNIFKEEGEQLTENAKVRELFKHVQHTQLQDTVKALCVRFDLDGITYTEAANYLTAAVSELPEFQLAQRVSSVKRIHGGGKGKHKRDSIYAEDGTIFTGYYSNFMSFSKEEHDKVTAERECKNGKKNDKRETKRKLSELQSLTEDITLMTHTVLQLMSAKPGNHEEEEKDTPRNDAGNCFGGRKWKAGNKI